MKIKFFAKKIWAEPWFGLSAVVLIALGLRLWLLALLKSLTFDEMISYSVAVKPFNQIWSYVRWEMHPPLHYYFLHFWLYLFGVSEISAHLSTVVLSVGAVVALYFLGKEVFSSRLAALAAATGYAVSPLFCFFGVWARMYSMLFLTATLSFLFFIKFIKARGRSSLACGALFVFFTLAALYTHLTAGLVVAIETVFLAYLVLAKRYNLKEIWLKFWAPFLIIVLAYGPWFWYFWHVKLTVIGGNAWYFNPHFKQSPWFTLIYDCLRFLTPQDGYWISMLAFSLLVILGFSAFATIGWDKGKKITMRAYFSEGAGFASLIFLLSFAGLFFVKLYALRYAIIPSIGLFLLLGYGFFRAGRFLKSALLVLFLIMTAACFFALFSVPIYPVDWKKAADFISQNEKSGDKIIGSLYTDVFSFDFYYHGSLPITAPLDEKYRENDLLLTAIKSNIYPTTNQNNISSLDDFLIGAQRVFLFITDGNGSFSNAPKISESWIESRGFAKVGEWPVNAGSSTLIWIMEKK